MSHSFLFRLYLLRAFGAILVSIQGWAAGPAAVKSVSWTPQQLQNGSPCLFKVELAGTPSSVTGVWMGKPLEFFTAADPRVWYALAGVDVEVKPGTYPLSIQVTMPSGAASPWSQELAIAEAPYRTTRLTVPEKFVQPDPETQKRIEAERAVKERVFATDTPVPQWSGNFEAPVLSAATDSFGTRRTFNGKLATVHRGLDYRASSGTPVVAANSGQVILARSFFYEGNFVVIDHGQNLFTMYMHLSEIQVAEGQKIARGQQIGLSGGTGRVTGPHLHLAARWKDAYLDPGKLLKLRLPVLP